jgi:hypothetical protein
LRSNSRESAGGIGDVCRITESGEVFAEKLRDDIPRLSRVVLTDSPLSVLIVPALAALETPQPVLKIGMQ